MDYVPVYEDEGGAGASTVQGLATIEIDPARQQLIGLKIAPVTRGKVSGSWRTFSKVAADEQRVRHINVKVPVFVEHVYVNFVGKPVRKGEALFSGYSPELLAAQKAYLADVKARVAALAPAGEPDAARLKGVRDALVAAYPSYGYPYFVELGLPAVWRQMARRP